MKKFDENLFEWLANQKGVGIVRLEVAGKVYHAVVVDGINGLIWDFEENRPMNCLHLF